MTLLVEPVIFSSCRTWRYKLARHVAPLTGHGVVAFIGLNPSTADEMQDDPTIRRCIDFARRWDFEVMLMLNLYAYRATDPKVMLAAVDPIGPENDAYIDALARQAQLVVCAWGVRANPERAEDVLARLRNPHALALTRNGFPQHPLYVPASAQVMPYGGLL